MTSYQELIEKLADLSENMKSDVEKEIKCSHKPEITQILRLNKEALNGIILCCQAMKLDIYSQVATLLRQLIEQIATIIITSNDPIALQRYYEFFCSNYEYSIKKKSSGLKELYKQSKIMERKIAEYQLGHDGKKPKIDYRSQFFSIGWIEVVGAKDISYDELLRLSNNVAQNDSRNLYSKFAHNVIFFDYFNEQGQLKLKQEFTIVLGFAFKDLCLGYMNIIKRSLIWFDYSPEEFFSKLFALVDEVGDLVEVTHK